jgi:hypothetical protein
MTETLLFGDFGSVFWLRALAAGAKRATFKF